MIFILGSKSNNTYSSCSQYYSVICELNEKLFFQSQIHTQFYQLYCSTKQKTNLKRFCNFIKRFIRKSLDRIGFKRKENSFANYFSSFGSSNQNKAKEEAKNGKNRFAAIGKRIELIVKFIFWVKFIAQNGNTLIREMKI